MSARNLADRGIWAAICGLLCLSSGGAAAADSETAITIYSSAQPGAVPAEYYRPLPGRGVNADGVPGYAMVSQDRKVSLASGRTQLRFTDVAALIDPTTVQFVSLSDPENTKVLEQNFQFDLVSTQKLLSKYVDKTVTVQVVQGTQSTEITGTLLSAGDGLVLRGADGQIRAINLVRSDVFRKEVNNPSAFAALTLVDQFIAFDAPNRTLYRINGTVATRLYPC